MKYENKTILFLVNHDATIYNFRKELVQYLLEHNFNVFISSPYGKRIDELKSLGCTFIDTPVDRRGTNPAADFKLIIFYRKIISEIRPDIVLTYTVKPNIYGGIACAVTGTPNIASITGLGTSVDNAGALQRLVFSLYKTGLKRASYIFFQNEQNYELFAQKRIISDNVKIIPGSGVNLTEHKLEEYPEDDGTTRFLFIGRIMREKGVAELLDAARKVTRQYPKTTFEFIGWKENEDFDARLRELEQDGTVRYSGYSRDVHSFIKKSHATVLPSYHEGMANVLLESASSGRPVLASRIPGCVETFDEEISGLSFESKNADDLADKLIRFIQLPYEQKKSMGFAGRKKMEREFDRNIVVDAYMKKINEICNQTDGIREGQMEEEQLVSV